MLFTQLSYSATGAMSLDTFTSGLPCIRGHIVMGARPLVALFPRILS